MKKYSVLDVGTTDIVNNRKIYLFKNILLKKK